MTLVEPIPDLQWGKGGWQDYISNWRTRDTNWMQERLILRYQTTAQRTTDWGATPRAGQVTFNGETNTLEMWHPVKASWVRSLMFQYLISTQDTNTGTNIHHVGAGGKGITIGPGTASAGLVAVATPLTVLTNLFAVDSTGVSIKTGATTAKITTDATALVIDKPLKATSFDAPTAVYSGAVTAGSFSAPSATITSTLTLTGATVNGGTLNGATANINGVQIATSAAHGAGGVRAQVYNAQGGAFFGDASGAVIRQRNESTGVYGGAYVRVIENVVTLNGATIELSQPRVLSTRPMEYSTGAGIKYGGPVIWGADPGVGNVPEGTIWAF